MSGYSESELVESTLHLGEAVETMDQYPSPPRAVSFYLPPSFLGLFDALDQASDRELSRWMAENAPRLEAMLLRRGVSRAVTRDAFSRLLLKAWELHLAGSAPNSELGWMRGVIRSAVVDQWRVRQREASLPEDLPRDGPGPVSCLEQLDERRARRAQIRDAATRLPVPYRQVVEWRYLQGASRVSVFEALESARTPPISRETSRSLVRRANQMLRAELGGESARELWPGRYSRRNPWILTPPPFSVLMGEWRVHRWPREPALLWMEGIT